MYYVAASNSSARDTTYANAVCDGTADEVEINAALGAEGAGGIVVLLPGAYTTAAPIVLPANRTLRGYGATITTTSSTHAISAIGTSGTRKSGIRIEGLTLIGPSAMGTKVGNNGITIDYCDDCTVVDCTLSKFGSLGNDAGIAVYRSNRIRVERNRVFNCLNGTLCGVAGDTTAAVSDSIFTGNTITDCWEDGMHSQHCFRIEYNNNICRANGVDTTAGVVGVGIDTLGDVGDTIVGNICSGSVTGSGIEVGNTTASGTACLGHNVSGNVCDGNALYGIKFNGAADGVIINGNVCRNSGEYGILVNSTSAPGITNTIVSHNQVVGNGTSGTFDGIRVASYADTTMVLGNHCRSNTGRGIYVTGSTRYPLNTIVSENITQGNTTAGVSNNASATTTVLRNNTEL